MRKVHWNGSFEEHIIYESKIKPGFCAWVGAFAYPDSSIGISFDEILPEKTDLPLPSIEFAEAAGVPVSYGSVECGSKELKTYRVYLRSRDGIHFEETGRCPREEGSFCNVAMEDGRIIGYNVPKENADGTGWGDSIAIRESRDGGNTWKLLREMNKDCSTYLWRVRKLRDGTIVLLASLYGTPWGVGKERATRNTMLPEESYIGKILTYFMTSTDGVHFTPPCYILPGIGAHEYDVTELPDGRLLFVAGDVQGTPVGRQYARKTEDGYILSPLKFIHEGAPMDGNPQGGFVPETLCMEGTTGCIIGGRRNKGYSASSDDGANWTELDLPSSTPYQPMMIRLPDGRLGIYGHQGGDNAFGEKNMVITANILAPAGKLEMPAGSELSLERCFSADHSHYTNAYTARLLSNGQPACGKAVTFCFVPFWNEDGSVNTTPLREASICYTCLTDENGVAGAQAAEFDHRPDIHLAYNVVAYFEGDEELRACESPSRMELAMTPYRRNPYPYDAYFAENTLYLSPDFLKAYPDAESVILSVKQPEELPSAMRARLEQAGAIAGGKWYHNVHQSGINHVCQMPEGDYYC